MKNLSKQTKIIIISCAAALLILATTLCIIIIPYYTADHVENTTLELFPIISELSDAIEVWEKEGYDQNTSIYLPEQITGFIRDVRLEINQTSLGKELREGSTDVKIKVKDEEHTLSAIYNKNVVAVGGINDEYILFPLQDFQSDLTNSVFGPESGSRYALDEESFSNLTGTLESLLSLNDEKEIKALENSLKKVFSRTKKQMEYDSKLNPFKGERLVEFRINKNAVAKFVDEIIKESDKNDTLKHLVVDIFYYTPKEKNADTLYGVDALRKMVDEMRDDPNSFDIDVSYTVSRKYIKELDLTFNIIGENDKKSSIKLHSEFNIDKENAGFTADISTSDDGGKYEPAMKLNYSCPKSGGRITAVLDLTSKDPYTGETTTTSMDASLNYNSDTKEFQFSLPNGKKAVGTFDLNAKEGTLKATVDNIYNEYYNNMFSWQLFSMSVDKADKDSVSIPDGKHLLAMNEEEITNFIIDLPIKKMEIIFYNLTGKTPGFYYTYDGRLIPDYKDLETKAIRYAVEYSEYMKNPSTDENGNKITTLYVYDKDHHVYILFKRNIPLQSYEPRAYALFPYNINHYHEAILDDNASLVIKK